MERHSSGYAARQLRAQQKKQQRKQALQDKYPQIAALLQEQAALRNAAAHAAVFGGDTAAAEAALQANADALALAYAQAIIQEGLPSDYLSNVYECSICQDCGYTVQDGIKRICSCHRAAIMEGTLGGLDVQAGFAHFDENVIPAGKQREAALKLRGFLMDYAEAFPQNEKPNLLLVGNTGLGKTFQLGCVCNAIAERGYHVRMFTAYRLQELFREQHISQISRMPYLTQIDFLAIDDLGSEPMYKNITIEYLFTLLNERSRLKKPTAIVTNLMPAEIQQRYGERILSRLVDGGTFAMYLLEGTDIRKHKQKNAKG
ncbi:ATP-binding protein [Eubacteriales bacterium OttesenSCG-928-N14]|nr:ATP-binding protein [Eubacteriales bacterium OttesenSCG-928-N14]